MASVCLLLVQVVFVESVEASCGDWLAIDVPGSAHGAGLSGGSQMEPGIHESDRPGQNGSCNGPTCRRDPFPETPTVPVPVTPASQQWLKSVADLDLLLVAAVVGHSPAADHHFESAWRGRLDRPPRG